MNGEPPVADGGELDRRRDNGLSAERFVPLADLAAALGPRLLDALGRARIAAYLTAAADGIRDVLFVAATERADARGIILAAARAVAADETALNLCGELAGHDTNSEFEALVAGWHVDTVAAIRSAERDLAQEDADWRARISPPSPPEQDEEEHYVPPAPPPLPRLTGYSIGALTIVALSIALLGLGGSLGLASDLTFLLGIGGILIGAGMLVMRLRARPDDEDDDGAIL